MSAEPEPGGRTTYSPPMLHYKLPADQRESELFKWWMDTCAEDFRKTVPKMLTYGGAAHGSADLEIMGFGLTTLLGERGVADFGDLSDQVSQQMACWFYLLGKVSRLVSDYRAGNLGKPDSIFDATIYCMMMRRIAEVGQWP